jgi:hypothetical protein
MQVCPRRRGRKRHRISFRTLRLPFGCLKSSYVLLVISGRDGQRERERVGNWAFFLPSRAYATQVLARPVMVHSDRIVCPRMVTHVLPCQKNEEEEKRSKKVV